MELTDCTLILILLGLTLSIVIQNEIRKRLEDICDYIEEADPGKVFSKEKR